MKREWFNYITESTKRDLEMRVNAIANEMKCYLSTSEQILEAKQKMLEEKNVFRVEDKENCVDEILKMIKNRFAELEEQRLSVLGMISLIDIIEKDFKIV